MKTDSKEEKLWILKQEKHILKIRRPQSVVINGFYAKTGA
jgi:hypothetical protein